MKLPLLVIAALLAMAAAPSPPLAISGGWTRPALRGATAAGYLVIVNRLARPDRLVAAASPVAASVTLHESRMVGSVMTMRPVASLTIPPRGQIALAPGGLHFMLEGLRRPLKAGEHVPLILQFAGAGPERASLTVGAGPPAPAMAGMKM
jgi:periplasmic copper chaperone A